MQIKSSRGEKKRGLYPQGQIIPFSRCSCRYYGRNCGSIAEGELNSMDIDLIFKIAGTGIIVAVLNLVLKRAEREEQAMMTTLAGLIVVLVIIVEEIGNLFDTVKTVFGLW